MLPLLLVAQLAVANPAPDAHVLVADPVREPRALEGLVARAAERNRAAPTSLLAYRAQVESEIAVLTRRPDGEEAAVSLEQSQNEVQWQRSGDFRQHMTAYRARQAGPSMSALMVLRSAWTIPMLYGNDFAGFFGDEKKSPSRDGVVPSTRRAVAVHPFGPEGNRVYSFRGGDTIAVIHTDRRAIPVVRVLVEPRRDQATWPVVVFRGEIDLDADRAEIVRLRGQFVTLDRHGPQQKRLLIFPVNVMAYVDMESVEIEGRYWLPRYQRIEMHVDVRGLAEGRSVFRIVSKFREHAVTTNEAALADEVIAAAEVQPTITVATRPHRLTIAGGDSLQHAREWWTPLGDATAALRGDDFADVETDSGARATTPRFTWRAQRLADVMRFNRVEGWSTGAAAEFAPGASAPNMTLRGNATWAWTERTVRGRFEAIRRNGAGNWRSGVRLGRTLDITNDFTAPRDSGGALVAALAGVDDYDYVDRSAATLWFDRNVIPRRATVRLELGPATDHDAHARLTKGPLGGGEPFRPNRGVDAGSYFRSALVAEWNPVVNANPLANGFGTMLRHEQAYGTLDWGRTTVRLNARADRGTTAYAVRIDGGLLTSRNAPPQQLFELGGGPAFPGYEYKEFAGDRAMAAHARASYRLPFLRSPLKVMGCTCLTSPAPELAFTLHGATLSSSSAATLASIARLGSVGDSIGVTPSATSGAPISHGTGGLRSSAEVGLRFFGGAVTTAMTRPLDTGGRWRMIVLLGQAW